MAPAPSGRPPSTRATRPEFGRYDSKTFAIDNQTHTLTIPLDHVRPERMSPRRLATGRSRGGRQRGFPRVPAHPDLVARGDRGPADPPRPGTRRSSARPAAL